MYKKILFIILVALSLHAKDEGTNFFLKGGLSGSFNNNISDFQSLPDLIPQGTDYEYGFGIGPSIMLGGEYRLSDFLFEGNYHYSFELKYTDLSANYSNEDYIGNDIQGNDFEKIYVDFNLEPDYSAIIIEHTLKAYLLDFPLYFKGGFQIGFPMKKEYFQNEELLRPNDVTFENGMRKRAEQSGDLPDASSLHFALTAGAGYDAYKFGSFSITPELQFNYGLTNVVNSLNWNIASVEAGINLVYNIPKAEVPPPANPKMPEMPNAPQPPEPGKLDAEVYVYHNGARIENSSTIKINKKVNLTIDRKPYLPVIYTDLNKKSRKPVFQGSPEATIVSNLIRTAKTNDRNISIDVYYTDEEKYNNTLKITLRRLEEAGIEKDKINISKYQKDKDSFRYSELAEEYNSIHFSLDGEKDLLYTSDTLNRTVEFTSNEIKIEEKIITEGQEYESNIRLFSHDKEIASTNESVMKTDVAKLIGDHFPVKMKALVNAGDVNGKKAGAVLHFIAREDEKISSNTVSEIQPQRYTFRAAYFKFDESEIDYLNKVAASQIRTLAAQGETFEIIGMTDNLGNENYNEKLARRRAENTARKLGLSGNQYEIKIRNGGEYSNQTPYGRTMNRTVHVKVK